MVVVVRLTWGIRYGFVVCAWFVSLMFDFVFLLGISFICWVLYYHIGIVTGNVE